ncbi:MAG: YebC/PmpR family DNA-binding transcriptional regulator [Cyanobacteriota bacterium]
MAGHSKWANIKHKKAKTDAQKGKIFTKFSREIIVAVKIGGPDPAANFKLKTAITAAKAAGLPNDNIKRSIEKASGSGADGQLESINYEGYGPGGIAIIIEALTDNRNRTAGDIRSYFNKNNGNLGETGCVSWMFDTIGIIVVDKESVTEEDALLELSLRAGADDFEYDDDIEDYKITTSPENLQVVTETIETENFIIKSSDVEKIPQNTVEVTDKDTAKYLLRLLDSIENHEDVQNVYANFEMDDALIEAVSV